MQFGSENTATVQGEPRFAAKSQHRRGGNLNYLGCHPLGPEPCDCLGTGKGSAGLQLQSTRRGIELLLHTGQFPRPFPQTELSPAICPGRRYGQLFLRLPVRTVVKLRSLSRISWSWCVYYPSHGRLISCYISLEIHL